MTPDPHPTGGESNRWTWRCFIGLHRWGRWEINDFIRQERRCLDCGSLQLKGGWPELPSWAQSPVELVTRLIDERDVALREGTAPDSEAAVRLAIGRERAIIAERDELARLRVALREGQARIEVLEAAVRPFAAIPLVSGFGGVLLCVRATYADGSGYLVRPAEAVERAAAAVAGGG